MLRWHPDMDDRPAHLSHGLWRPERWGYALTGGVVASSAAAGDLYYWATGTAFASGMTNGADLAQPARRSQPQAGPHRREEHGHAPGGGPRSYPGPSSCRHTAQAATHASFAEALDDVVVCVMTRSDVQRLLLGDARIAARITETLGRRLGELEQRLSDAIFKSVPERITEGRWKECFGAQRVSSVSPLTQPGPCWSEGEGEDRLFRSSPSARPGVAFAPVRRGRHGRTLET